MSKNSFTITSTRLNQRISPRGLIWANLQFILLLIFNVSFWLASQDQQYLWVSSRQNVIDGAWFQLFTSPWLHFGQEHFLSNLVFLFILEIFIFGFLTNSYAHSLRIFVGLWLGGALVQAGTLLTMEPTVKLLGASGVVFLSLGFWLSHYWFLAKQKSPRSKLLRIGGLMLLFLIPEKFAPDVSYMAHGIGLFVGLVAGVFHYRLHRAEYARDDVYEFPVENVQAGPDFNTEKFFENH